MPVRPIVKYGEPVLHAPAAPVTDIDGAIRQLLDDMVATMWAAPGIGLAAPQIGVSLRVIVVDLSVGEDPEQLIKLVNPEFVERDGEQREEEGCLSIPDLTERVVRPERVLVRAMDESGQVREIEGTGLLARALSHEIDHLNGLLFVHRLKGLKRELPWKKVERSRRKAGW